MKKFVTYILLIMLAFATPKSADALVIDVSSIASKTSDWVGKITDMTNKITQQVSQIKQMATQGLSKDGLRKFAEQHLKKLGKGFTTKIKKKIIDDTKGKEQQKLQKDAELHKTAGNAYYDAQTEMVLQNLETVEKELEEAKAELNKAKKERDRKKSEYEEIKKTGTIEEINSAFNEYDKQEGIVQELELLIKDLEAKIEEFKMQKDSLAEEQRKIGTDEDKDYKRITAKQDALKDTGEDIDLSANVGDNDEWDDVQTMKKFETSNDVYKEFIDKYFYKSEDITASTEEKIVKSQAEMDRVMRARRQLIIENASHLLQLTASIRRNIPTRTEKVKGMFDEVVKTDSELQAIGYYSGTRIENMRALLMYARLQSAKLQYMSAKDLLTITPYRRNGGDNFDGFKLDDYILTSEYVDEIVEKNSKTINLNEGVEN